MQNFYSHRGPFIASIPSRHRPTEPSHTTPRRSEGPSSQQLRTSPVICLPILSPSPMLPNISIEVQSGGWWKLIQLSTTVLPCAAAALQSLERSRACVGSGCHSVFGPHGDPHREDGLFGMLHHSHANTSSGLWTVSAGGYTDTGQSEVT